MKIVPYLKSTTILMVVTVSCLGIPLIFDQNVTCSAQDSVSESSRPEYLQTLGLEAFDHGEFEQAANHWRDSARLYDESGMIDEEIDVLIQLGNVYQVMGQHPCSLKTLDRARELSVKINDGICQAAIFGAQGNAYLSLGLANESKQLLEKSVSLAREAAAPDVEATALNNLGNLLSLQKEYGEALDTYDKSINLAIKTGNNVLTAKASINAARAAVQWQNPEEMEIYLNLALEHVRKLDESHEKAYGLIALGQIASQITPEFTLSIDQWRQFAYQVLTDAVNIAESIKNPSAESYALGYLAQLYEDEKRNEEASYLTNRAIFMAQQANAPEILYQWHRQNGRLLKNMGDINGAIGAYLQSVRNLQTIRQDVSASCRGSDISFRQKDGLVYLELADLYFERAETQKDPAAAQDALKEARDTIERLRRAELCDYFQDACVTALQEKEIQLERLERISGHTSTIYSIVFPDRLELLLNLPDETIKRFTVNIDSCELEKEVRAFRRTLEKNWKEYITYAKSLYDKLIRPLESDLRDLKINTLVFIPDDFLRTIPMAALHDGNQFLIGKYAIAIMPGRLTFIKRNSVKEKDVLPLLAGLTKSVQNNSPLPKVAEELENIQEIYGGKLLLDENFNNKNLEKELKNIPYTIVHMATHGIFQGNARESCLWTYDGRLTMNDLEMLVGLSRFREKSVELLTLSACETAAGDDQAALGLAGVAVKAGARSALATLWFVGDEVAALLIPEFYRQLKDCGVSKAEALRQAQLKMLSHEHYSAPGFWSAFLLTGDWL